VALDRVCDRVKVIRRDADILDEQPMGAGSCVPFNKSLTSRKRILIA